MYKSCDNCKYDDKGLLEEPCLHCKNGMSPGSSKRESAPFLWEPGKDVNAIDMILDEEDREETIGVDELINDSITPSYYNDTKIAPIDVIEDWDLDFCLGSALKYIKRCGKKDNNPSVQDLRKVIWYVERRIKELEEVSE